MAVLEKNWYVVRAVSGQENKVKNYIESEISRLGYGDYVEQVLVPTEKGSSPELSCLSSIPTVTASTPR